MDDNRREGRKNLQAFTPVYSLRPKTLLGYIEDLTLRGAMIIGEKMVEEGKQMTLSIEIPGDVSEATIPHIAIPARVAWCKKEERSTYFRTGFEFVDLSSENEKIVEAILRRYTFRRRMPLKGME